MVSLPAGMRRSVLRASGFTLSRHAERMRAKSVGVLGADGQSVYRIARGHLLPGWARQWRR